MKIRRPIEIKAQFEDEFGEVHTKKYSGLESRVFQHELDHMNGKNFTERVGKLKLDMAYKRRDKQLRKAEQYSSWSKLRQA